MSLKIKAQQFFDEHKSMKASVENFIYEFMTYYNDEGKAERELLSKCVQQMFRKYYYSVLVPQSVFTPANIVNTLYERNFGNSFSILPTLSIKYRRNKISGITCNIAVFNGNHHPMVKDLEFLLKAAVDNIAMDAPGIVSESEYIRFKDNILIFDRHYINILCLIAIEAGYLELIEADNSFTGKAAEKSKGFFMMDKKLKLKDLINTLIKLCSNTMTEIFPLLKAEFTYESVEKMLKKPKDFSNILTNIYKKYGFEMNEVHDIFESVIFNNQVPEPEDYNRLLQVFMFQSCFDMYFLTPFGYYLQLIQPIYEEPYDFYEEADTLLSYIDDYHFARNILFTASQEYDLTVLGEKLLNNGRKSIRKQKIQNDIDDEFMYQTVLFSQDYDDDDYDEEDDEYDLDDNYSDEIEEFLRAMITPQKPDKSINKEPAKVVDFNERKNAILKASLSNKIFAFKVKIAHAKRIWRQIEIKGNQSLDDLHWAIFYAFELEPNHMYSFYMSNKAFDKETEYHDPEADGINSATEAEICSLNLDIKQKFMYLYDYRNEHKFEVELISINDASDDEAKYPREVKRSKEQK